MTSTLRGRITRAVNALKRHLNEFEEKEDEIHDRATQKDQILLSELDQIMDDLTSAASVCETTFAAFITYISQIQDPTIRQTEDDKAAEIANSDEGLEDTLDRSRELVLTLKRLRSSLKTTTPVASSSAVESAATASESTANGPDVENETDHDLDQEDQGETLVDQPLITAHGNPPAITEEVSYVSHRTTQDATSIPSASLDLRNFLSTDSTRLKLPSFNGKKSDFLRFWSLFEATIDQSGLNDTVKLHILLSHLTGDAAQLVSGFTFDPRNYEAVKQTLKERYSSKGSVERRLYEDLLSLKNKSSTDFPSLIDRLESILNQMSAYSIDVEVESIRMTVGDSLPSWVRPHLLQAQLLSDQWTTAILRKTLKKLALIADHKSRTTSETITVVSANTKKQTSTHTKKKFNKPSSLSSTTTNTINPTPARSDNNSRSGKFCSFCKFKGHTIDECRKKKAQSAAHTAAAVSEDLQELPTVQMSTSIVQRQEVPLMLVKAPIVNLTTGRCVKALVFLDSGAS